jgi:hypothetical protein
MKEILEVKGQIVKCEIERLIYLASLVPENGLIVEIGAYCGRSGLSLATGKKESVHLVSIDPWMLQGGPTHQEYETEETMLQYRKSLSKYIQQVTQVIGWPVRVGQYWGASIDMLFVDCVKKYEWIAPIWKIWFPFVKSGGIVCSHDYGEEYPGVVRAITEIVEPNVTDIHLIDFTWDGVKK